MLRTRVIPCLLLSGEGLVKTVNFKDGRYLGDPINAVKLFNDKGVDELAFLDIRATVERRGPNFSLIETIASQCFMPLAYGGGITTVDDAIRMLGLGVEKVILNSAAVGCDGLVTEVARRSGSQSLVVSIDVRKHWLRGYEVRTHGGTQGAGLDPVAYARRCEELGAGEILLTSIDRDGTMRGYDIDLIRRVTAAVSIPVIASGGAGKIEDFGAAVRDGGAAAVAAGSLFVYQGRHKAFLINYPSQDELARVLA